MEIDFRLKDTAADMDKLVSILIPLYNAERWIAETIESALAQTWANKEIIIVNDGSTDNSLNIAKRYESDRVKIISQTNQGCSAAKQMALAKSKGDFIQYLDADDLLSKNKIESQVRLLLTEPDKVAVCRTIFFYDGEDYTKQKPLDEWYLYDTDDPVEFLVKLYGGDGVAGMVSSNAFLTPKSVADKAGGWDISISPSPDEDSEYFCRMVLASSGIRYADEAVNYYRKYRDARSLSRSRSNASVQGALRSLDLKTRHILERTNSPRAKRALARAYKDLAVTIAYPDFPSISEAALQRSKDLGETEYMPSLGGWKSHALCKVFGWKVARKISVNGRRYMRSLMYKGNCIL